ncbi:branched-chain amino acid ABC transporter permease, partial [Listeria monocytogenes]|nr:branched-chain amino acid ABC transporter permease [Listeria monocytogenes]
AFFLINRMGLNYWWGMAGAAVTVALISVLSERLVFHPLRKAPYLHHMIASIGILLFLEAGAQALWGADFHRMDTPYTQIVELGSLTLP